MSTGMGLDPRCGVDGCGRSIADLAPEPRRARSPVAWPRVDRHGVMAVGRRAAAATAEKPDGLSTGNRRRRHLHRPRALLRGRGHARRREGAVRASRIRPKASWTASRGSSRAPGVAPADVVYVAHGTTVATNTLLQRHGARTALITTRGFRDLLEIARQRRPSLYDLDVPKPRALVRRKLRREVPERVMADGSVRVPLDLAAVDRVLDELARRGHRGARRLLPLLVPPSRARARRRGARAPTTARRRP